MTEAELNQLSSQIIKAAINVHNELGPGLLESVYNACMIIELADLGLDVKSEIPVPIVYRGRTVSGSGFRLDLLVNDVVIVELKSIDQIQPVHKKQLLTYLRLLNKPLGLLINFNEVRVKDGIHRVVNSSRDHRG
ncbi:MAG TPA: GxxExxY protein [Syntrophorhabdales bacterium]|nr:GxxExxY protein [Syntrophorhabdales bacterium]